MHLIETQRLNLRQLTEDDWPFIFAVVNDPDFLRNIGDRGVRNEEDARRYIANGPQAMYREHGFGLYRVALKDDTPIGLCGLIKREALPDVDIGFSLLPQFRGRGYALEAARAVMQYGREKIAFKRIVAIAVPENKPSVRLLEKVGLCAEGIIRLPGDDAELLLMAWETCDEG